MLVMRKKRGQGFSYLYSFIEILFCRILIRYLNAIAHNAYSHLVNGHLWPSNSIQYSKMYVQIYIHPLLNNAINHTSYYKLHNSSIFTFLYSDPILHSYGHELKYIFIVAYFFTAHAIEVKHTSNTDIYCFRQVPYLLLILP